jgi:hypothetical protein
VSINVDFGYDDVQKQLRTCSILPIGKLENQEAWSVRAGEEQKFHESSHTNQSTRTLDHLGYVLIIKCRI